MQNKYEKYYEKVTAFALVYNQEDFVEECVLSLLNQNCPPIEIIISDDASTDKSFEIIQKFIAEYNGPHKVVANKNVKNMGLIPHYNSCVKDTMGDFLIGIGGDDYWALDRVKKTVEFWVDNNFPAAICINPMMIDAKGNHLRRWQRNPPNTITAEGMLGLEPAGRYLGGFRKRLFDVFGPLP